MYWHWTSISWLLIYCIKNDTSTTMKIRIKPTRLNTFDKTPTFTAVNRFPHKFTHRPLFLKLLVLVSLTSYPPKSGLIPDCIGNTELFFSCLFISVLVVSIYSFWHRPRSDPWGRDHPHCQNLPRCDRKRHHHDANWRLWWRTALPKWEDEQVWLHMAFLSSAFYRRL